MADLDTELDGIGNQRFKDLIATLNPIKARSVVGATYPYGRYKKEKEGGIGERTYMGRSLLKNLLQSSYCFLPEGNL